MRATDSKLVLYDSNPYRDPLPIIEAHVGWYLDCRVDVYIPERDETERYHYAKAFGPFAGEGLALQHAHALGIAGEFNIVRALSFEPFDYMEAATFGEAPVPEQETP